ncbi:MAG TPA: 7TM domain-containing protein [Candidatus Woesebacteria bacterium]|nr:7TM domain-containing protein [Candidatus Woesebacteria bacterium]
MYFKKILVSFLLLFSLYLIKNQFLPNGNPIGLTNVRAQTANPVRFEGTDLESLEAIEESTPAAAATDSTSLASPSAEIVEKIQQKADEDITETTGRQKSVLAAYLDEHPIGPLNPTNFLQKAIRQAIAQGLPASLVVIILIFPVIASLVAFARHVVGFKGFGIYIPAVLSVAFVSTGLVTGIILFIAVLLSAMLARYLVQFLKMPLLPKTAMLLLIVSIAMLLLLTVGSFFKIDLVLNVSIFPLLIIILLTENFMTSQMFASRGEALNVTFETLILAVVGTLLIDNEAIQRFVILKPELTILLVVVINFAIAHYTGLRILEYFRFKDLLRNKSKSAKYKKIINDDSPGLEE